MRDETRRRRRGREKLSLSRSIYIWEEPAKQDNHRQTISTLKVKGNGSEALEMNDVSIGHKVVALECSEESR